MEKLELYKCEICGNVVEVVLNGEGTLVCCGEDMKLMVPNTQDGIKEKHVPFVEDTGDKKVVKVGIDPHPMTGEHYIEFIEVISEDKNCIKRKYLNPEEAPELVLNCMEEKNFEAREHCNIHGLYSNKGE